MPRVSWRLSVLLPTLAGAVHAFERIRLGEVVPASGDDGAPRWAPVLKGRKEPPAVRWAAVFCRLVPARALPEYEAHPAPARSTLPADRVRAACAYVTRSMELPRSVAILED